MYIEQYNTNLGQEVKRLLAARGIIENGPANRKVLFDGEKFLILDRWIDIYLEKDLVVLDGYLHRMGEVQNGQNFREKFFPDEVRPALLVLAWANTPERRA